MAANPSKQSKQSKQKKATTTSTKKRAAAKSKTKSKTKTKSKAGKAISPEAMMAACMEAATPGKGHRSLEPLVGSWSAKTTFWMAPDAPAWICTGTSEHRWVLGGRYLRQEFRGAGEGGPFEGIGYTGYDNGQQKFVGTWMDSMGTGIMASEGAGKPTSTRIAFTSKYFDPASKKEVLFDSLIRVQDRDHHTYEMWTLAPNGKRFRTMVAEYTRR
jgi:hypothetical protein